MTLGMNTVFNISGSNDVSLKETYERSMRILDDFFETKWVKNQPKVYVVDSRATIDSLQGSETQKWLVGWDAGWSVYVLDRDSFKTDAARMYSNEEYQMLITHELAHVYFKVAAGGKIEPKWLWEGVSIFVSGQAEVWDKPENFKSFLDNNEVYTESGYAILLLVNKYGKSKLIQLLKQYKVYSGEFTKLFEEVYGFLPSYETFNQLMLK
jgi:hypothetical protein